MLRHVPDDELHAYLDQALSRSQCVEIETHLAECARCSDRRDANAALRDRTTALLAQLTPRALIIPPPFETLVERHIHLAPFVRWQRSLRRAAAWAAGIAAAVGAGWAGRSLVEPPFTPPLPLAPGVDASFFTNAIPLSSTPFTASSPATPSGDIQPITPIPLPERPRGAAPRAAVARRAEPAFAPAPTLQLILAGVPAREGVTSEPAPLSHSEARSPFDRIWRSVTWEEALQIAGSGLPFIEGLPVVGVLVQPGSTGERPTVIVAQQDGSGEIIQSIEGPVGKVTEMLQRQSMPDIHVSALSRTPPDYVDEHGGVRRAIRVLTVTGRLTVDSLNSLAKVATIR